MLCLGTAVSVACACYSKTSRFKRVDMNNIVLSHFIKSVWLHLFSKFVQMLYQLYVRASVCVYKCLLHDLTSIHTICSCVGLFFPYVTQWNRVLHTHTQLHRPIFNLSDWLEANRWRHSSQRTGEQLAKLPTGVTSWARMKRFCHRNVQQRLIVLHQMN